LAGLNQNCKCILLVDDDETVLKTLGKYLELKGFTVETAKTGREAIQKSQRCFFNLAILDVNLPDMNGADLLVVIDKSKPEMKKIMLTGYPDLIEGNEAIDNRADACLIKPIEPSKISQLIEQKLIEQKHELEMGRKCLLKTVKDQEKQPESTKKGFGKISQTIMFPFKF
jgi:DNA-binding NtrC family response regulator